MLQKGIKEIDGEKTENINCEEISTAEHIDLEEIKLQKMKKKKNHISGKYRKF